jgi:hypothetical protein
MMFKPAFFAGMIFVLSASAAFSQQPPQGVPVPIATSDQMEKVSKDMSRMTASVTEVSAQLKKFFEVFSTNQGLRMTEKQQKLLFAFEILNRSEQRLSTLQTLKVSLSERQSSARLLLARINDDLLPESIERYVGARGTTNAEQLRQMRQYTLDKEKFEVTKLISDIDRSLEDINRELRSLELLIRNTRDRLFGEINKELLDL